MGWDAGGHPPAHPSVDDIHDESDMYQYASIYTSIYVLREM
jgi:hypothetical protein